MAFNISYIYQAFDRFTPTANKVARAAGRVNNKIKLGTSAAVSNVSAMDKMTASMAKFAAIAAIVFSLAQPIRQAVAFESAMADVAKVVDFKAPDGLDRLSQQILTLSRVIPLTATEISAIVAAGGQLGVLEDKLIPFANTVSKISVAFDIAAAEAGNSVAKLSNIFEIPIERFDEFADAINEVSNNTASAADEIVRALTNKGAAAGRVMGLTANEALGLASTFIQLGVNADRVGSVMDSMSRRLTDTSIVGDQFAQAFADKPQESMIMLFRAIKQLEGVAKAKALKELFGEFSGRVGVLIDTMDQKFIPTMKLATNRMGFLGSVTNEYTKRAATADNKMTLLGNSLRGIAISIGNSVLPEYKSMIIATTKILNSIDDFINRNKKLTATIFTLIAALTLLALGALVVTVIKFAAVAVITGVATIAMFAFRAISITTSLSIVAFTLALVAWKAAVIIGTSIMWLFNAALAANPIGLIIVAVVALVAGIIWLINNLDFLKTAFDGVMTFVSETFETLKNFAGLIMDLASSIGELLGFSDTTIKIKAQAEMLSLDSAGTGTLSGGGLRSITNIGPAPDGSVLSPRITGPAPSSAIFGPSLESKSSVNVTITAPQGVVKDVKSRSSGNTKLNVGQNFRSN